MVPKIKSIKKKKTKTTYTGDMRPLNIHKANANSLQRGNQQ